MTLKEMIENLASVGWPFVPDTFEGRKKALEEIAEAAYKAGAKAHAKALGLLRHPAHAGAYNLQNEVSDEFLNSLP